MGKLARKSEHWIDFSDEGHWPQKYPKKIIYQQWTSSGIKVKKKIATKKASSCWNRNKLINSWYYKPIIHQFGGWNWRRHFHLWNALTFKNADVDFSIFFPSLNAFRKREKTFPFSATGSSKGKPQGMTKFSFSLEEKDAFQVCEKMQLEYVANLHILRTRFSWIFHSHCWSLAVGVEVEGHLPFGEKFLNINKPSR